MSECGINALVYGTSPVVYRVSRSLNLFRPAACISTGFSPSAAHKKKPAFALRKETNRMRRTPGLILLPLVLLSCARPANDALLQAQWHSLVQATRSVQENAETIRASLEEKTTDVEARPRALHFFALLQKADTLFRACDDRLQQWQERFLRPQAPSPSSWYEPNKVLPINWAALRKQDPDALLPRDTMQQMTLLLRQLQQGLQGLDPVIGTEFGPVPQ